jgi:hypothetical protein
MRSLSRILLSVALFAALLSPAALNLPSAAQSQNPAARLAARAVGATPMLDDLQELCDLVGGRPTGSPACARAVQWGAAKFRAAGISNVSVESFTVPNLWLARSAEASCVSPQAFPIRLASAPSSASTSGNRPLEAKLVDAGDGSPEAFAKLGPTASGAIALVRSREMKTLDDLFAEYLRNGMVIEAAQKAHASALLLQSTRPRGLLYRHPVSLNGTPTSLPVAVVSREHAARLARLLEKSEVRLRLSISNQIGGPYESQNVVADIRGSEHPEEIVVLGAHLDSWDLGTGANDNGVNAALVLDVARGIKQLELTPRRTIRFVFFTGEEQGMWGSVGYVTRHAAELDQHVAALIFDIGSGRTDGFYLNGREELRQPVEAALRITGPRKVWSNPLDGIDGTDNFDFLLAGVPNLVANQDAAPYLPDYHADQMCSIWSISARRRRT